jgi:hypothetical protein
MAATDTPPVALTLTPAVFWALARVSDRHGPLTVSASDDGHTFVLVDTAGRLVPDIALELDSEGRVVGKTLLSLPHRELEEDDGLGDLADEELVSPSVLEPFREGARLAGRCRCPQPWADEDGTCARCGHVLPQHGLAA